jgi:branched-chain amino acid transport system ATP-binding protein
MLKVDRVYKSFDKFLAVNGAELTVEKGQLVAVIGPNGAGKTTLFNLITGMLKPDRGRVIFNGEDISKLPPHDICRKGIARSFQIANVFPRLTVFKNVQVAVLSQQRKSSNFFRPAHSMAVDETNQILASVGLLGRAEHLAGSLSHGDHRILEIAIALGNEPRMLILDEPTAGMSPDETSSTMALIQRLAETVAPYVRPTPGTGEREAEPAPSGKAMARGLGYAGEGDVLTAALTGAFRDWHSATRAALARVLLLDQFTRNAFRDTPRAFAGDAEALATAIAIVDAGLDRTLDAFERWFLYLPFEHAENVAMQQDRKSVV